VLDSTLCYASDLWSLGVCLWQMFLNSLPFTGDTPFVVMKKVTEFNGILVVPSEVPPNAANLIRRLMTIKPQLRLGFATVADVKAHLFFGALDWDALSEAEPPPLESGRKGKS